MNSYIGRTALIGICAAAFSLLPGCASVTQGLEQTVKVETLNKAGKAVRGAECELSNDKGTSVAVSGQSAVVRRSGSDLTIHCNIAGELPANGTAISRANAGMAGNIILGGAIGAIVDASNGAAFTYPLWMQLVFGEERVFDRSGNRGDELSAGTFVRAAEAKTLVTVSPRIDAPQTSAKASSSPIELVSDRVSIPLKRGDALEYVLINQVSGNKTEVVYRLDRVSDTEMSFNEGGRIERLDGQLVSMRAPIGGMFDASTPPEGWFRPGLRAGMIWNVQYPRHKLRATVTGEERYLVDGNDLRVFRISYTGWQDNLTLSNGSTERSFPMRATVLYSPVLNRIVRFDGETRAVAGTVRESLQLQRVVRN